MAATIPENFKDLLSSDKKAFGTFVTLLPSGQPQATPVWVDYDGTHVIVNSALGRLKDKNVRRDPRVALAIQDPANPYRYLEIRGRVVEVTQEGADAGIDRLAKKYLDKDKYPWRGQGEVRVIFKIEPTHVGAYPRS